jgi:hypothetical protein
VGLCNQCDPHLSSSWDAAFAESAVAMSRVSAASRSVRHHWRCLTCSPMMAISSEFGAWRFLAASHRLQGRVNTTGRVSAQVDPCAGRRQLAVAVRATRAQAGRCQAMLRGRSYSARAQAAWRVARHALLLRCRVRRHQRRSVPQGGEGHGAHSLRSRHVLHSAKLECAARSLS